MSEWSSGLAHRASTRVRSEPDETPCSSGVLRGNDDVMPPTLPPPARSPRRVRAGERPFTDENRRSPLPRAGGGRREPDRGRPLPVDLAAGGSDVTEPGPLPGEFGATAELDDPTVGAAAALRGEPFALRFPRGGADAERAVEHERGRRRLRADGRVEEGDGGEGDRGDLEADGDPPASRAGAFRFPPPGVERLQDEEQQRRRQEPWPEVRVARLGGWRGGFQVDRGAWAASPKPIKGTESFNCAPLVPVKTMRGAGACHMCGRCSGHRGAVRLALRSPNDEIVHVAGDEPSWEQTCLILFGMLGLAVGARTMKMHQGHHGANHPVKDETTGKVEITSMNHGFAVDQATLPAGAKQTHISLFDGSNCGIALEGKPVFSVQYHPEASPGPRDSHYLFRRFADLMREKKRA